MTSSPPPEKPPISSTSPHHSPSASFPSAKSAGLPRTPAPAPSPSTLPSMPTTPASPAARAYDAWVQSPAHQRFRAKYLAVGIAIIAASGALFGAELKTLWQNWRANEERKITLAASSPAAVVDGKDNSANAANDSNLRAGQQSKAKEPAKDIITISDLNRSIASLDTVRGQLMRRKQQEEQRLMNLRSRMERKRDLEDKRAEAAVGGAAAQTVETIQPAARPESVGAARAGGR